MNKIVKNNSVVFVIISLLVFSSCQKMFEEINTDHRNPTEYELQFDDLNVGGFVTDHQKNIFPVGSSGTEYVNDYQIPYTLAGACWMGYMAPAQNKWVGRGFPTYSLKPWSRYTYDIMGGRAFRTWMEMKKRTQNNPSGFAIAQIIKIAAVHKAADTFGPIPYSQAGQEGKTNVEYDSQDAVYKAMLEELDEAVKSLSSNASNVFPKYDLIYEGNYVKWCKFANSLMLRLAMRVVYADAALAKKYAEKAITNPFGVIESIEDEAKLSKGAGISLRNPLVIINNDYNDVRMGAEIYSYMKGYNDPRMGVHFTKAKNDLGQEGFYALRTNLAKEDTYLKKESFSCLNVDNELPIFIIRASEVAFLRAEAVIRNFEMGGGTAEAFYNTAISLSFQENGLKESSAQTYCDDETALPARYDDYKNSSYSINPVSMITIKWKEADDFEKKLERIITQKYLALYPNGQEAWSEFRRTGYPKIFPAVENHTDCEVDSGTGPKRIPYPEDEYKNNKENIDKAVKFLGGADNGATRLWWDCK